MMESTYLSPSLDIMELCYLLYGMHLAGMCNVSIDVAKFERLRRDGKNAVINR
jgi:hypothetical protein